MATRFLSDAERASPETWPAEISHTDLVAHFAQAGKGRLVLQLAR